MSRTGHDQSGTIAQQQEFIRQNRPDLVICVHHNGNIPGAAGSEVLAQINNTGKSYDDKSRALAEAILDEAEKMGRKRRPIIRQVNSTGTADKLGVLRTAAQCGIPAVITEWAFMSGKDVVSVDTYAEQQAEAKAIARAIKKVFG
jgi:N-acetylmuramoyl-L-alanine amidase